MNKSIWIQGENSKEYKSLENDIETDVCIIGGGLTGISTRLLFK